MAAEYCGKLDYPSPEGRVAAERSEAVGWGEEAKAREMDAFQNSPPGLALLGHPPQPKSDESDLGHLKVPNSGKPEFGGEGGRAKLGRVGSSLGENPHPTASLRSAATLPTRTRACPSSAL